jgi:protein phosphatase
LLLAHGVTNKGRIRTRNEDNFTLSADLQFCAVADGMGGHNAGDVAARVAIDALVEFMHASTAARDFWPFGIDPSLSEAGNRIRTAIHMANQRVLEASAESAEYEGMGTTVVAALVDGTRLAVGHVGDSRLYLLRGGQLRAMTRDDSWAVTLARDAHVDPALIRHHPMRNALTNVVGIRVRTDVHVIEEPMSNGDCLLLTTDGVHGTLEDERIEQFMLEGDDLCELANTIVSAALARGSRDNCTALVARYLADESASPGEATAAAV